MAETTNPLGEVAQAPQDVESRMANFLTQFDADHGEEVETPQNRPEPTAPQAEQVAEQPEGQATDELTPEDIPADPVETQPAVDAFEIVHNGTQHKLTREDTIKYAQQGFDYTQKTQALAETQKAVATSLQRAEEIMQLQVALGGDMAEVRAIEGQLKQWMGVDWVQLATSEPLDYPKYRAQFDVLQNTYQQAVGRFNQKAEAVKQQRGQILAQQAQQEKVKLIERIPAWKDPAKAEIGVRETREYLKREGVTDEQIDGLNDSIAVAVAWKAAQYDKLLRAKTDKVKQLRTAPPVTRSGSGESATVTNAGTNDRLLERLKKTGDKRDAAALLANRWK